MIDDPKIIRARLDKLKQKELLLECDLAIKEYPKVEKSFYRLAEAYAHVVIIKRKILLTAPTKDDGSRRALEAQIKVLNEQLVKADNEHIKKFLQSKITTATNLLERKESDFTGGLANTLQLELKNAIEKLVNVVVEEQEGVLCDIELRRVFPCLLDFKELQDII